MELVTPEKSAVNETLVNFDKFNENNSEKKANLFYGQFSEVSKTIYFYAEKKPSKIDIKVSLSSLLF